MSTKPSGQMRGPSAGIESLPAPPGFDLQLWRVRLDEFPVPGDIAALPAEERARAERFLRPEGRRRFVAARFALRQVLGECTQRDPVWLTFSVGEHGKPRLVDDYSVEFNLSHSGDECLIGVSRRHAVGVDVERLVRVNDFDALSRRHFTAREQQQIRDADPDERRRAFLLGWTRKEACMKALGFGLTLPPAQIDAGCDASPGELDIEFRGRRWRISLATLALEADVVGAVALATETTRA